MADRELMTQARNALIVMLRQFTRTPSSLRDTQARGQAHEAIKALDDALASGVPACEPCPRGDDKPEPSCTNRRQCWEPCGELGNDEKHVRVATAKDTAAIKAALGLPAADGSQRS